MKALVKGVLFACKCCWNVGGCHILSECLLPRQIRTRKACKASKTALPALHRFQSYIISVFVYW